MGKNRDDDAYEEELVNYEEKEEKAPGFVSANGKPVKK